jgi:replication initiation protein RepC
MLSVRDQADAFKGAPAGSVSTFRYLAAFQEAEPYLGLPPQAFKLVSWLVKQTMPCDWEEGARPICWPSAARQAEFLGLSPARVKILNRALYEAGIFVIRDSETGKRYGRRSPDGRIIEAYGFDLSPLAVRYDEFIRLAAEARAERERLRGLKKRATCARRAIRQGGEMLEKLGALPQGWLVLAAETAELVAAIRGTGRSDELALIVKALESRKNQVESWLRDVPQPVETSPEGPVNEPHNISTNQSFDSKDTVIASDESSRAARSTPPPCPSTTSEDVLEESVTFKPYERVERLHPGELLELAPRLRDHTSQRYPSWHDIVDAAGGGLCFDLGVSKSLWVEACQILGRQLAAITLAIVSTKPKEHFTRGAGGYFSAMVKRAQKGELHLDRSLWKLRRDKWGGSIPKRNAF